MPNHKLDATDLKILRHLQDDGRMSLADLAAKVGLSPSPCLRRVRIMEKTGVTAQLLTRAPQLVLDRFARTIARWPEVVECYLMTGPRDYWLRVVVPDLAAYERFLKTRLTRLEGIASIESSFALEQVKYTNVLPVA